MEFGSIVGGWCDWRCIADVDWERGEGATVLCRPVPMPPDRLARLVRGGMPFCWLGGLEAIF